MVVFVLNVHDVCVVDILRVSAGRVELVFTTFKENFDYEKLTINGALFHRAVQLLYY